MSTGLSPRKRERRRANATLVYVHKRRRLVAERYAARLRRDLAGAGALRAQRTHRLRGQIVAERRVSQRVCRGGQRALRSHRHNAHTTMLVVCAGERATIEQVNENNFSM